MLPFFSVQTKPNVECDAQQKDKLWLIHTANLVSFVGSPANIANIDMVLVIEILKQFFCIFSS